MSYLTTSASSWGSIPNPWLKRKGYKYFLAWGTSQADFLETPRDLSNRFCKLSLREDEVKTLFYRRYFTEDISIHLGQGDRRVVTGFIRHIGQMSPD